MIPVHIIQECLEKYCPDKVDEFMNTMTALHEDWLKAQHSIQMPFGKHKGASLLQIMVLDYNYLRYLYRAEYVKENFPDIYDEVKTLLNK